MGLEFDRVGRKQKTRFGGWMPVLGLILAVALGFISYLSGPPVAEWLGNQSSNFPPAGVNDQIVNYGMRGVVFVVLLMASWSLVAAFAPRSRSRVTDKEMVGSRKEILDDKKSRKKRRDQLRRNASADLRKKNKAKK
jgi:hypothetical protein